MPIRKYIDNRSFEPDVLVAMGRAFESAVKTIKADTEGRREIIASRIIAAAQKGETDVERLRLAACSSE